MPQPNDTSTTNTSTTQETEVEGGAGGDQQTMTAEQFNRAMTSRERAFEKRLAAQQAKFEELLNRIAPPAKEEKELSRTSELEKTVKELSKGIQDRDARDRDQQLRRATETAALKHGIDPEFREHALAYLVDHKKAVRYDGDGNIVFVLNGVEYDDLEAGMAMWANSKDAKAYKTPSGAKGSGDGNRRSAAEQAKSTGQLTLKRKEGWETAKDVQGKSALTLTGDSKAALQQLVAAKLSGR